MAEATGGPSPYINSIRSKIGHELLLLPAVTTLIWDEQGRVLLVRHAHNGQWGTVGGMVEPDEAPADAARREALEEVGVTVQLDGIRGAIGGPDHRITYPNGDQCSVVAVVYDATIIEGTITPDDHEVLEARWFSLDDLAVHDLGDHTKTLFGDFGLLEER